MCAAIAAAIRSAKDSQRSCRRMRPRFTTRSSQYGDVRCSTTAPRCRRPTPTARRVPTCRDRAWGREGKRRTVSDCHFSDQISSIRRYGRLLITDLFRTDQIRRRGRRARRSFRSSSHHVRAKSEDKFASVITARPRFAWHLPCPYTGCASHFNRAQTTASKRRVRTCDEYRNASRHRNRMRESRRLVLAAADRHLG